MTKQEQEIWQTITESGGDGWTEDTVFRLTGRGALYRWGDSDGRYISVSSNGLLSVGSFNEAFPHMGKAFFTPEWSRQYAGFDKAMDAAHELGGEEFWDEVYSPEIGEYDGLPLNTGTKYSGERERAEQKQAPPHAAILFSRVQLWTDDGEESEFWVSGEPQSYDDIEDTEGLIDFQEFLDGLSDGGSRTITAAVTTFYEGAGALTDASPVDIERIENAVNDVDVIAIADWNRLGQHSFSFDYDLNEPLGMGGIE